MASPGPSGFSPTGIRRISWCGRAVLRGSSFRFPPRGDDDHTRQSASAPAAGGRGSQGGNGVGEFVDLYTPLLYSWARRLGLQPPDASDLVQDVFLILVRKLPEFHYDPQKSFRAWLRTVFMNRWRDLRRRPDAASPQAAEADMAGLAGPDTTREREEAEHREYLVRRALELMRREFQPNTWMACWEQVVNGRPGAEVARELGMSVNAVYLARSRVLRRVREYLEEFLA
jgi:RNA polymerase sigma-70 factor, ECF subfamily